MSHKVRREWVRGMVINYVNLLVRTINLLTFKAPEITYEDIESAALSTGTTTPRQ